MSTDVENVGTLRVQFTTADLSKFAKKKQKKEGHLFSKDVWYEMTMTCQVSMADEAGILQFSVVCQGVQCGVAQLEFSHD